jgi:hypothetical protein
MAALNDDAAVTVNRNTSKNEPFVCAFETGPDVAD